MNHLENNPAFMKRFENAVEFTPEPAESTKSILPTIFVLIIVISAFSVFRILTSDQDIFIHIRSNKSDKK